MHIVILAEDWMQKSIQEANPPSTTCITWVQHVHELVHTKADVYIDALYDIDGDHDLLLQTIQHKPIWLSSVIKTIADIGFPCIRFNGWKTLFNTKNVEIATPDQFKDHIIEVANALQWNYTIVPDMPGLITPKVITMIINEAYYALQDKVSSKKDIDTAMELGTNYPYGPFEWAGKIGLQKIYQLLEKLSISDERYVAANALQNEASMKNS